MDLRLKFGFSTILLMMATGLAANHKGFAADEITWKVVNLITAVCCFVLGVHFYLPCWKVLEQTDLKKRDHDV